MKFGLVTLDECEGAILAHAVYLPDGRIRKGTVLRHVDISRLRDSGRHSVIVAQLEDQDIDENNAADSLARTLMPANVRLSRAATGRVNIYAVRRGIVRVDRARLTAINTVNEGITLASVQHNQLVEHGDMIATLKIIPYGVDSQLLEGVLKAAGDFPAISFYHLTPRPFALIQTKLKGIKRNILASTEKVTKTRLNQLGCALVDSQIVNHDSGAVSDAISQAQTNGAEIILVCGASAICDRRDVVPEAVLRAGGEVVHFGMPAGPGNLLMTAHIDGLPIIGMPGCARSPRLSGFDWVLHLVLAGIPLDDVEIADMAVGGLLMEIESRPLPRRMVERRPTGKAEIGGILLAAGMSQRMGALNKLTLSVGGEPLVRCAAKAMLEGGIADLVVVTGHESADIKSALAGLKARFIHNEGYADGQAGSVAIGISALAENSHGALIALGDMPFLSPDLVAEIIADHSKLPDHQSRVSFPVYNGRRGNPVLWGQSFFDALAALSGDIGGRAILSDHPAAVNSITWGDDSIHLDIDTMDDFDAIAKDVRG